eukprot:CAMPEP_0169077238 /NCGR_PEP_ID=MMETSP1015-20121227/8771_1 /TAXON_ID=342587 /ORGANISM="Karlodinium micrum, Strain CCMP2283" /LENGTH=410 /DNA_ID=CAMNT_0009136747 /DNA_START=33 /DNA_END=1265 /DNA_ORIENTATION=+
MAFAAISYALISSVNSVASWSLGDFVYDCTSGDIADGYVHGYVDSIDDEFISLLQTKLEKVKLTRTVPLENLQWLHIPKSGTSFIATLWNFGCGQGDVQLDYDVDAIAGPNCSTCYDFALMDRYPKEIYCRKGVFSDAFETQHQPVTLTQIAQGLNVVGFFRLPRHRIASAFNEGMHASGFSHDMYKQMTSECRGNVTCFANFPGIAGCATRMLTGQKCANESSVIWPERITQAIETVHSMAFVGLTEQWNESICLFHLMFGSRLHPAELKDYHPTHVAEESITKEHLELSAYVDEADEAVYAAAKARYNALFSQHVPKGSSACTTLHEREDSKGARLIDMSCKSASAECGLVADKLDCGVCPSRRLEFVEGRIDAMFQEISCSSVGKCVVDGQSADGLFAWDLPARFRS